MCSLREQGVLHRIEAGCLLLQERRHTGEQRRALELADIAQDSDVRLGHVPTQEERPQRRVGEELAVSPRADVPVAESPPCGSV